MTPPGNIGPNGEILMTENEDGSSIHDGSPLHDSCSPIHSSGGGAGSPGMPTSYAGSMTPHSLSNHSVLSPLSQVYISTLP